MNYLDFFGSRRLKENPFGGGIAHIYNFNDNASPSVDSINSFNGVQTGGGVLTGQAGKVSDCYQFFDDNRERGLVYEDFNFIDIYDYTVLFWMKIITDFSGRQTIVSSFRNGSAAQIYIFTSFNNFGPRVTYGLNNTYSATVNVSKVNDGNWHRCVVRHKYNEYLSLNIDNLEEANTDLTSESNSGVYNPASNSVVVGRRNANFGDWNYKNLLNQLIIVRDYCFTDLEIAFDWNNGNGRLYT